MYLRQPDRWKCGTICGISSEFTGRSNGHRVWEPHPLRSQLWELTRCSPARTTAYEGTGHSSNACHCYQEVACSSTLIPALACGSKIHTQRRKYRSFKQRLSLFVRGGRAAPTYPETRIRACTIGLTEATQMHVSLSEHLRPIRRHKRLKYMQAPRSSSQRIRRSKSWYHTHELGRTSRQSRKWMSRVYHKIRCHVWHVHRCFVCCASMCGQTSACSQDMGHLNVRCSAECMCLLILAECQQCVMFMQGMQKRGK